MATASRNVRKLRRIKRERSLAYKGMDLALKQRDIARMVAGALETELKKYTDPATPDPDNFYPEGDDPTEIQPALTIKRVEEEAPND
jgi:hypothetical protein